MYYIIVNPVAGRGKTLHFLPYLTKRFDDNNIPFKVHITEKVMDGYHIAKESCQSDCLGIIGIGGDGTMQEIATGMIDGNTKSPLGIFVAGSGNDFAMSLEGSKSAAMAIRKSPIDIATRDFFERVRRRQTRTVDIIKANGMAYLNIGNIGLDARIVKNAIDLKPKYGRHAYLAAVYKSIIQHENMQLKITADGKNLDGQYTLIAICNGQYYGGGMRIAPGAKIDDGKMTLCLVDALSRPKTMVIFPSLMMEQHTRLKAVRFIECEEISITSSSQTTLCLDGNLYPIDGQAHFKILPKALDVFV